MVAESMNGYQLNTQLIRKVFVCSSSFSLIWSILSRYRTRTLTEGYPRINQQRFAYPRVKVAEYQGHMWSCIGVVMMFKVCIGDQFIIALERGIFNASALNTEQSNFPNIKNMIKSYLKTEI